MRVEIMQDPDKLMDEYAHRLNYNYKDALFMQYFRDRTGVQIPTGDPDVDPYRTDGKQHIIITQCRLQDCWEIFNQYGVRQEYAMQKLLEEGRRNNHADK